MKTANLAQWIWNDAVPAEETPAEIYLRSRGLLLPPDAPIRFHSACPRGSERLPAMLALMTDPVTGEPCGTHRTFLKADGSGKAPIGLNGEPAKMMAGRVGVIRLTLDEEVSLGLGLVEGVETGLAVLQRGGWAPVWVATSAGSIRSFPVLAGIEVLTIFADSDDPGMNAARACCERYAEGGREARILAPPVGDWDDALPQLSAA